LQLVHGIGLAYAGIDLIVTPEQEVVFLELGPYSSWVWVEEQANGRLLLTATLTDFLVQRSQERC
jgi:hypothetical protein